MPFTRLSRRILAVGLALLLSVTFTACLGGPAGQGQTPDQGLAPDFSLNDLNGQRVTLSQYRGKPVMLNFWASWCGPCRIEIPEIQSLYEAHAGDDSSVILAVNFGEPAATVRAFVQENKLSFRVLIDEDSTISRLYRVQGIPATLFVNKQGRIVETHLGPLTRAEAEKSLAKAAQS